LNDILECLKSDKSDTLVCDVRWRTFKFRNEKYTVISIEKRWLS